MGIDTVNSNQRSRSRDSHYMQKFPLRASGHDEDGGRHSFTAVAEAERTLHDIDDVPQRPLCDGRIGREFETSGQSL